MKAQAVVSLAVQMVSFSLLQSGITFAFAGNVAQTLYGETQQLPTGKIELSLFSPVAIFELKQSLALTYPGWFKFVLTSRRLWYFDATLAAQPGSRFYIEVVIVASSGSPSHLVMIDKLPLVPYTFILLRELMFWDSTSIGDLQSRGAREASILHMLKTLRRRSDFVHDPGFDEAMHVASVERVARFSAVHPSFREEWKRMGLMTHRMHKSQTSVDSERSDVTPISHDSPIFEKPNEDSHALTASFESMGLTAGPSQHLLPWMTIPDKLLTLNKEKRTKPPRMQIRRLAARMTVEILKSHGFPCALFGSMACKLYGNKRVPNDVDVLVLPPQDHTIDGLPPTQESLKELLIVSAPTSFVLRPPRDPEATYKLLYFIPTPTSKPTSYQASKVDILLPGAMSLPTLSPSRVSWRSNVLSPETRSNVGTTRSVSVESQPKVPVLPFHVLLLQKLQAWDDHRHADEVRYREKTPVDVEDLEWMLGVAVPRYLKEDPRRNMMMWENRELFDEEFEKRSKERVVEFCEIYPRWTKVWKGLGFEVP